MGLSFSLLVLCNHPDPFVDYFLFKKVNISSFNKINSSISTFVFAKEHAELGKIVKKIASSAEFVGELRLGQVAKLVI